MSGNVLELKVGARVWFDGGAWTVCEVPGAEVRLRDSHDRYRLTAIDELLGRARDLDAVADTDATSPGMSNVALSALTAKQRGLVDRRLAVLAPLLQASSVDSEALGSAAAALGVSTRTVRRRLEDLRNLGPGGLIDERLLKDTRRSVDPRWDEACTQVLRDQTNRSTPSRATVIRQANAAFLAAVPEGQVPSKTVAYQRVEELDRGRYTFGEAKQRRSVAKRPQGVLGQLRPTRPGEYVLMDGYKLDVFAMEPVTMRWVNTELTVAMDLYDRSLKGIRLRPVAAVGEDAVRTVRPVRRGPRERDPGLGRGPARHHRHRPRQRLHVRAHPRRLSATGYFGAARNTQQPHGQGGPGEVLPLAAAVSAGQAPGVQGSEHLVTWQGRRAGGVLLRHRA